MADALSRIVDLIYGQTNSESIMILYVIRLLKYNIVYV